MRTVTALFFVIHLTNVLFFVFFLKKFRTCRECVVLMGQHDASHLHIRTNQLLVKVDPIRSIIFLGRFRRSFCLSVLGTQIVHMASGTSVSFFKFLNRKKKSFGCLRKLHRFTFLEGTGHLIFFWLKFQRVKCETL